jgi:hypothetical protein
MNTFSQKDYQSLLVGKSGALKDAATINALADGEIGIFTPAGVKLTEAAATTSTRFILAVGRGTGVAPLQTPVIDPKRVTAKSLKTTVAAAEQVDYIGYNGTSGSIAVANSTVYRASINLNQSVTSNHGGLYIKDMVYKSDASATQEEIAQGLAKSAIANFSREANQVIKFERIANHAGAANTGAGNFTVTNGSNRVIAATDIDAVAVVGDYFRIGGTNTVAPVYKIIALDTTNQVATLDTPYQGATGTVTEANTEVITAAQAAAATWGLKLTGVAQPFSKGKLKYNKVRWTTSLSTDGFGATVITNSATAKEGTGTYEQIAELEWFVSGNNGEIFRMGEPNIFAQTSLVANEPYDLINIEFEDGRKDSLGYVNTPKVVTLAIPNATPDYAVAGTTDDITDVLEILLDLTAGDWAL